MLARIIICLSIAYILIPTGSEAMPPQKKFIEQMGVLSTRDDNRLALLSKHIYLQHIITNDDLDFWIKLLKKGPIVDRELNRGIFETRVIGYMLGRKNLTANQKHELYMAILPYTRDRDDVLIRGYKEWLKTQKPQSHPEKAVPLDRYLSHTQIGMMDILLSTNDAQALPILTAFAEDSKHPSVRRKAIEAYYQLSSKLKRNLN